MQRVINFSGGKTSAYMTIMLYTPGDIVLFLNTEREETKTYEFIDNFERHENIPITRVSYKEMMLPSILNELKNHLSKIKHYHRGRFPALKVKLKKQIISVPLMSSFDLMLFKRDYKRLPNRMMRSCTEELKVNTAKRYLKSIGVIRFENIIGFRFDEPERVKRHTEKFKKVITSFPLYDMKVTKQIVNDFWLQKDYTLEIPSILGNCDLCFMKGKNVIISILRDHPELADKWIKDEDESNRHFGHTYLPNTSFREMLEISQRPQMKQYDLFDLQPAFNCACTT